MAIFNSYVSHYQRVIQGPIHHTSHSTLHTFWSAIGTAVFLDLGQVHDNQSTR